MPQFIDPAMMAAMERRAHFEAAQEIALREQMETNRKFAALVERARGWFEADRNDAQRITPKSWDRASIGLTKTISSGNSVGILQWNGHASENLTFTIDSTVQTNSSAAGEYPQPTTLPGGSLPRVPYDYSPYLIASGGAGDAGGDAFEVDIDTGARITLPGSFLTVKVAMDAALAGYAAGTMTITAYIGLFGTTTTSPAKRTRRTGVVVNGTSSLPLIVPARAKQLMSIRCSVIGANGNCHVQDAAGNDLDAFSFSGGFMVASVPLPLGAYQVVIDNTGAAPCSFQVPFQLAV